MLTSDLEFDLPPERIASEPTEPRDSARMLLWRRDVDRIEHLQVRDLPGLGVLSPGDLMLVNQSRVLPACLTGIRRETGGHVGGLYLRSVETNGDGRDVGTTIWEILLESGGKPQVGEAIDLDEHAALALIENHGGGRWYAQLQTPPGHRADTVAILERVGLAPLPPYIRRARKRLGEPEIRPEDTARYNTVYAPPFRPANDAAQEFAGAHAGPAGSVAAPTAGLHFTTALLDELREQGIQRHAVELHVGMGTFAPVTADTLDAHQMHAETIRVSQKTRQAIAETRAAGGRILAVGTTTVRTIESLPDDPPVSDEDWSSQTQLFIQPGFTFRHTDALLTNFHLPRSSLLALVAALPGIGVTRLLEVYREAIEREYRFYSYGDAMLIV